MRRFTLALAILLCGGIPFTSFARAQATPGPTGTGIAQASHCGGCGTCETCSPSPSACGCDSGCGGGCDDWSALSCASAGILEDGTCLECNIGDPYAVLGHCGSFKMGGWAQLGYHNKNLILFNSYKHHLQLHQAWLFAEKELPESGGIGGRVDYIYGTDGPDTQAFGIDNGHWDNDWDHGGQYGNAIPQAYLEMGNSDFSVKAGKFFTIIGYEVVAAPDNFFYSHAYTMYNSEPFTHTGAIATYSMCDDIDVYGGYVLGWDSGFEDNGDAYLGGSSLTLTDDITLTYATVFGRFADNAGGNERGYMQSIVTTVALTESWEYIFQNDWLDTEDANDVTVRDTIGINQYLINTVNDCWSYGARFEWWRVSNDSFGFYGDNAARNFVAVDDFDIFALTLGLNYKPCANAIIRPEIRWDWVSGRSSDRINADFIPLEGNDKQQTTFGMDAIFFF